MFAGLPLCVHHVLLDVISVPGKLRLYLCAPTRMDVYPLCMSDAANRAKTDLCGSSFATPDFSTFLCSS